MSYDEQTVLLSRISAGPVVKWIPSGLVVDSGAWSGYAPLCPPARLCGTCAHWRPREPEGAEQPIFGFCASPRVVYGHISPWPTEEPPAVEYAPNPNKPDEPRGHAAHRRESLTECADMLLYSDYESYEAELLTGRHFGCVHWSAKGDE